MKRAFRRSVNKLLRIEGGSSNHPSDPGGKTRYGITEDVARKHGYKGDMNNLPLEIAIEIYGKDYWDAHNLDKIAENSEAVAYEIFECAVNTGNVGVKFLQRALNVFNKDEEYYEDIKVDGILGEKTLRAYKAFFQYRKSDGMAVLLKALNSQQGSYYIRLAEKNSKFEDFVYGWIKQRVEI